MSKVANDPSLIVPATVDAEHRRQLELAFADFFSGRSTLRPHAFKQLLSVDPQLSIDVRQEAFWVAFSELVGLAIDIPLHVGDATLLPTETIWKGLLEVAADQLVETLGHEEATAMIDEIACTIPIC